MFFATPPPPRAMASRANGFSFLSWKGKVVLAASVLLCGGGLAAQFPRQEPDPRSAAFLDSATDDAKNSDYSDEFFSENGAESNEYVLARPQRRYAQNADPAADQDYAFAEPAEPIRKYSPPPGPNGEETPDSTKKTQEPPSRTRLSSSQLFGSIDYSGLEKKALNLPLADWNPLFDKAPPLSEPKSAPRVEVDALVPSRQTVMKPDESEENETTSPVRIDVAALVAAEKPGDSPSPPPPKLEAVLRKENLVPASPIPDFAPILSLDQIHSANEP